MTNPDEQTATVLVLRPSRRRKENSRRAALVRRGTAQKTTTGNVIDLSRARRRSALDDLEPQGGDAA
jgi:hypothetical protein